MKAADDCNSAEYTLVFHHGNPAFHYRSILLLFHIVLKQLPKLGQLWINHCLAILRLLISIVVVLMVVFRFIKMFKHLQLGNDHVPIEWLQLLNNFQRTLPLLFGSVKDDAPVLGTPICSLPVHRRRVMRAQVYSQ